MILFQNIVWTPPKQNCDLIYNIFSSWKFIISFLNRTLNKLEDDHHISKKILQQQIPPYSAKVLILLSLFRPSLTDMCDIEMRSRAGLITSLINTGASSPATAIGSTFIYSISKVCCSSVTYKCFLLHGIIHFYFYPRPLQ